MADEAARALGAPTIAGTFVNPKGLAKKMTASVAGGQVGGLAGTLAASAVTDRKKGVAQETPSFGRVGYLAVTDTEVVLMDTRTGAFKMKIGKVLVRAPRDELTAADLDGGMMLSHLTIKFSNGATWHFDVPRQGRKDVRAVARELARTLE